MAELEPVHLLRWIDANRHAFAPPVANKEVFPESEFIYQIIRGPNARNDFHIDPGPHFSATPDYVDSWPPHCVVGTPGTDFHPDLATGRIQAVFTKGEHEAAYSGFQGHSGETGLADWLRQHDVSTVDIVGIATDHCVRATALDAARGGLDTTVLLELTAGVSRQTVDAALTELRDAGVTLVGEPVVA